MTRAGMVFDEFLASAILMFVIFALKDDTNKGQFSASGAWFPLGLFFLIFGIGACFGWQTGYAINLARDFGPRLMSYAVGYGHEVWSAGGYYFWIPMVIPCTSRIRSSQKNCCLANVERQLSDVFSVVSCTICSSSQVSLQLTRRIWGWRSCLSQSKRLNVVWSTRRRKGWFEPQMLLIHRLSRESMYNLRPSILETRALLATSKRH